MKKDNKSNSACCGKPKGTFTGKKNEKWNNVCLKCGKPFIPVSEKECICAHKGNKHEQIEGKCGICIDCPFIHGISPTKTPDWMEEFDDLYQEKDMPYSFTLNRRIKIFISSRIEEARKEGYEKGFDAGGQTKGGTGRIMYQRGLEQGRQEEKARIVRMIEGISSDWKSSGEIQKVYGADYLLANLKSDE